MEKHKTFTLCLTFGEHQKRPSTRNVHGQLLNIERNLQMVWPAIMWESCGQMIGLCGHIMAVEYEAILQVQTHHGSLWCSQSETNYEYHWRTLFQNMVEHLWDIRVKLILTSYSPQSKGFVILTMLCMYLPKPQTILTVILTKKCSRLTLKWSLILQYMHS